ncbi:MAG TPA: cobalamin biosynthesis protein CobW, partial [Rhodobacteraceae bacterium]|nr:cobalamin biosynthesis protein CobW [Paracoccaceae bacterium]
IKGRVLGLDAPGWEIHRVCTQVDIKRCETPRTQLVALGPAAGLTRQDIENWWAA